MNDLNFHMFLFSYDLIILTEFWIEKITIVALMQEGQENSKSALRLKKLVQNINLVKTGTSSQ